MYAKIENGVVVQYPYSYEQLKATQPQTSWPNSMPIERLNDYGVHIVVVKGQPEYDATSQKVVEQIPIFNETKQQWEQSFAVIQLDSNQIAANIIANARRIKEECVSKTQQRLDDWANERDYDGILSLCTYATDGNPKFSAEGQCGVDNRSATWARLYQLMAEVESGARPLSTRYEDIEPLLPELVWPT